MAAEKPASRPYRRPETCEHTKMDIRRWDGPGGGWFVMCSWCWTEGEPSPSAKLAMESFDRAVKLVRKVAGKRDGKSYG